MYYEENFENKITMNNNQNQYYSNLFKEINNVDNFYTLCIYFIPLKIDIQSVNSKIGVNETNETLLYIFWQISFEI